MQWYQFTNYTFTISKFKIAKVIIDLIVFGDNRVTWNAGNTVECKYDISSINLITKKLLAISPEGHILFFDTRLGVINQQMVTSLVNSENRITLGIETHFPELLSYSVPSSYFNLQPSKNISEYTSWLASLRCCLIDKKLLTDSFLDERFLTVQGAALHWGIQQLYAGAIIRYTSAFGLTDATSEVVNDKDQIRLVKYHQGFIWAGWTCFRLAATKFFSSISLLFYLFKIKNQKCIAVKQVKWTEWKSARYNADAKVTILIPTVDRYPYLIPMLEQLRYQTVPAFEIIVIDQTKKGIRMELNAKDIPLKIFYMDESGQCRSRNLGLLNSIGDHVLFLDDDDEVYPELIEDHLKCLSYFKADVSCGICQEPGSKYAPAQYKMIRMADVFPTNNGMVKREVLGKSGLFDMAYDRGQRADGDLGARVFLSGAKMILNPEISVIHHRAPQGGLRKHNVRKVTYGSSRTYITHRRLPHTTELYFNKRFFTPVQQREYKILTVLGTFSVRGGLLKKLAKFLYSLVMLPSTLYSISSRDQRANEIIKSKPQIPELLN